MAKKKWYVVVVGKGIGVFETWLEVGPLVKGVPDALHQSFPTEEQARRVFAQAMSRGDTRIVGNEKVSSPRQPVVRSSTFSNGGVASPSMSSIVMNNHHDMANHAGRTGANFSHPFPSPSTPIRVTPQNPISRASSEPSSRFRRYEIIDSLFKEEPESVEAQVSVKASTPTTNPTGLNPPRMETCSDTSRGVIVKTPTWLTSYPQRKSRQFESQPLSPLNSADMPLNTFIPDRLSERPAVTNHAPRVTVGHPKSSPIRATKSTDEESIGESSIYLSPSPHQTPKIVYKHDVDPRSPIMNKTQVPELAYISSLNFSRPSPAAKNESLPTHREPQYNFQSSLLFQSSPVSSSVEESIVRSP